MDYGLSAFSECFACLEKKFQVWFVCWPNTSPLLYISISHIAVTSVMDTGIYWYLRQDCGKYFIVGKWKYLVQIKISLKWAEWPSSTASRNLLSTPVRLWWERATNSLPYVDCHFMSGGVGISGRELYIYNRSSLHNLPTQLMNSLEQANHSFS